VPFFFTSASSPPASVASTTPLRGEGGEEFALLLRLGVSTIVVLGLLLGALFLLKRYMTPSPQVTAHHELQVLGMTRIDRRSQVFLVQARGQKLLVGADFTGIKLIVTVPPATPTEER
jgi:flagellar biogenesis protein FliO